jgi:hypothetical protein
MYQRVPWVIGLLGYDGSPRRPSSRLLADFQPGRELVELVDISGAGHPRWRGQ